jgi:hypothetical protein
MQIASPLSRIGVPIAAAVLAVSSATAAAQDFMSQTLIKPGEETFTLNLGGIVNSFDTKVQLNGETHNGTDFNLENNGLKDNLTSFEAAASWRFLPKHRIDVVYFSTKRSGSRNYSSEITIGDEVFPIGATVSAEAKADFLLADYRYSFIKSSDVELAGLIGFYGANFKYDINAVGNETPSPRSVNRNVSTTVPLPLIGASVDWYVNPRWKIGAFAEGIKANIGDVDGHAFVAAVSTDYMFTRSLGVGARYMYSDASVDVSKSGFNGSIDWRMNSWSLYAKLMF